MDNHVHILVSTNSLTKFMSSILISYVKWYNLKYSTSGNLFQHPFLSVSKSKTEWIITTSMYILQNPVKAGICNHPSEFKWSSYAFHFKKHNSFRKFINIDTSLCDSYFSTEKIFFHELSKRIIQRCELSEKGNPVKVKIPDYEVISETNKYLSDHHSSKKITELNRLEKIELIKHLNFNTSATARQIASITQENYRWVLIHCKSNSEES